MYHSKAKESLLEIYIVHAVINDQITSNKATKNFLHIDIFMCIYIYTYIYI